MSDAGPRTTRRLSSGAAVCVWENKAEYEYEYEYVYGEAPRPNKPDDSPYKLTILTKPDLSDATYGGFAQDTEPS